MTTRAGTFLMLKINVAESDGKSVVNEDLVGYCAAAAWVIDGATGVGPSLLGEQSDAAWLARTADVALRRLLAEDPLQSTPELVRRVIATCRDSLSRSVCRATDSYCEYPSAAFAMVRVLGDEIELSTLGDCRIAYRDDNGSARLFGSTSMEALEAKTLALVERIVEAEPHISAEGLKINLLPQLRANRARMNTIGGYWVLGLDESAADHMDHARIQSRPGDRFALASDGFLRLVDLFNISTASTLLEISTHEDWLGALEKLRALEAEPNSRRHFPRVKVHDDASFVSLAVGADI
jgi:serine/threonine protein phosphatase PrpC